MWQNNSKMCDKIFTTVQYNSKMKCDKIEVYLPLFNEMWQNRSLFTTVQYNSKMKCDKIEVYLPLFNRTARWNVTK